jgi:DNA-binding MarR family transcriptional regulator
MTIGARYVNMADIISKTQASKRRHEADLSRAQPDTNARITPTPDGPPQSVASADLMALVELFFFAYRDFTGEADAILAEYELGRAHHRVLHFVNRKPGMRVADLLDVLKVTKQSLARVLKTLVDDGWIEQISGVDDRRERLLYLTERGRTLADRLSALQMRRIAAALAKSGTNSAEVVRAFLDAMIAVGPQHPADGASGKSEPARD